MALLRICLVVAILAGGAGIYLNFSQVKSRINTLITERDDALSAQRAAEQAERQAKTAQQLAEEAHAKATNRIARLSADLAATEEQRVQQKQRADDLAENLRTVTRQRNEAQDALARWQALETPIEQVRTMRDQMRSLANELEVVKEEKLTLTRQNRELERRLDFYEDPTRTPPELPAGTRGSVVAVDPKYNFVVLNIGGEQEVVENARMMVVRDGKLVAKVRVTNVQPNRSIANILPEWQQEEVMEGDTVLY